MEETRAGIAAKKLDSTRDSYRVTVDIEHTLYPRAPTDAEALNQYADYRGADVEFDKGDLELPNIDAARKKLEEVEDAEVGYDGFREGSGEWPGLDTVVDAIWAGDYDAFDWMDEGLRYRPEEGAPRAIADIKTLDHVEDVEIVTNRQSDLYDGFEDRMAEIVTRDFPVSRNDVHSTGSRKVERDTDILIENDIAAYHQAGQDQLVMVKLPDENQHEARDWTDTWVNNIDHAADIIKNIPEENRAT